MNISITPHLLSPLRLGLGVASVSLALMTTSLFSQEAPSAPLQTYPQYQSFPDAQTLSAESLNQLLAPIALYPDALVALILPASTVPSDIVLASRFLTGNGDPRQIPNQTWDNSVQSLASYPEVVTWMDQNLEWTSSLGQAFLVQPADVMNAIQQLRAQAQSAGNLVNTPQQVIVKEKTIIRIVPAEAELLYVPIYDPEIVYVRSARPDYGPLISFGLGFAVGSWLNYDFDWNRRQIYRGDWQPGWDYSRHGNNKGGRTVNVVNLDQKTAQPWQASFRSRQQLAHQQRMFQRPFNNVGEARTASEVTAAAARGSGLASRRVPKPSRASFGDNGGGGRTSAETTTQPSRDSTLPTAENTAAIQTNTPPNVAAENGKLLPNPQDTNGDPDVNRHGQQAENTFAPDQIGGTAATTASKKQQQAEATSPGQRPHPTKAPVVDQDGRTPPPPVQPPQREKQDPQASSSPPTATASPLSEAQPSATASGKKSGHNNGNLYRSSSPPAQTQPSQPAPRVNPNRQHPQAPSRPPQQAPRAPKEQDPAPLPKPQQPPPPPKKQKPAAQQQPQAQQQQKPQQPPQAPQKQPPAPQAQPQQEQRPKQQRPARIAKPNPEAPTAKTPGAPAGKKSDKKD